MALEYVNKSTFSGAGSATLTGINSTDTYIVHWKNIQISNNNTNVVIQFTVSGSPQTSAVYNYYQQRMGAWSENKGQNQNYINMTQFGGTGTYSYPAMEGFLTLYSFNTNNVEPMIDGHIASIPYNTVNGGWGHKFGGVYKNTSAQFDGIRIYNPSGGTVSGEMVLYRLIV